MWQNLLKDRFGLKSQRATARKCRSYALVVGKNGPKFGVNRTRPRRLVLVRGRLVRSGGGRPGWRVRAAQVMPKMGKDGMPEVPAGMRRAGSMMMMIVNGKMRLVGTGVPIARLVDTVARQYNKPVIDQTGLTKLYDFTLDFAP